MTATGPPPGDGAAPAALDELAEDAPEFQHPVLRRLQRTTSVGDGARRGAGWAAGSKVMAQLLQFLGIIVTARLLTPEDYGKAAIVIPLTAFAGIFSSLGLGSAVIHARRVTESLLSTAFWLNAVTGLLLTGLFAALATPFAQLFRDPELVPLLLIASLNFTLSLDTVHLSLLERTLRFKQLALLETIGTVVSIGTIVVAALLGAGAYSIILGPLAYTVARTVLTWSVVRWVPRARPDRERLRELWSFTRGITGFNLLVFWSRNADNLLLARFVSQVELGNYSRAYNVMKLPVSQMQVVMGRVLFPALTRLRDDRPRLGRAWLRALSLAGMVIAPLTLGMAVAAPAMVEVLFGPRWLGMVVVLQILAVSALPQTLTTTVGAVMRATGATDALFRLGVATAVSSLVAMLVGLPWGSVGVATALAVKAYLEVPYFFRPCLRQTGLSWRQVVRALRGVWGACVALAAVGLALRYGMDDAPAWQVLLAQVAGCALAYVGALALLDRAGLRELWRLGGSRRSRARSAA